MGLARIVHASTGGCDSTMSNCSCHLLTGHDGDHACDPTTCGGQWTDDHVPVLYPGLREDGTAGLTEAEGRARALAGILMALYPEDGARE